jgi:hypothetical protein
MSFERKIQNYVEIDNQLKLLNERAKQLREERNEIDKEICGYIEENFKQGAVIQITDGKLKVASNKKETPLSFKFVEKCLNEIIHDEKKVESIIDYIKSKRESVIEKTIKRIYNNN